jgi:hypothetical protein
VEVSGRVVGVLSPVEMVWPLFLKMGASADHELLVAV